ncbi:MAG: DnaD domain protein [bacterium]
MSFCSYAEGAALFDTTPIENLFLMEYMLDAPESALKVYLYARMLALHPELGGSLGDIAQALRMDENKVYDLFIYWENRGLVRRLTDQPPTYAILPVFGSAQVGGNPLEQEMRANRAFTNRLSELFNGDFIGDHEIRRAADWQNILKFDQKAILRMLEYAIESSRKEKPKPETVFKNVNKLAEKWSKQGIRTLADVERVISEEKGEKDLALDVLKKLGLSRQPSEPEMVLVKRWTEEWGYDREAILAACDGTTSARNPSMQYINGILKNQLDENQKYFGDLTVVLKELNPQNTQPTPDQITRYAALIAQGFAPETIRLAAVQCHRKNQVLFDDLIWRLDVWRGDGVFTPDEADAYMRQMATLSKELREVFRIAGSEKRPGYNDLQTYRGWKDSYPVELIHYAAECSRNAGGSMAYMDKLLTQWRRDGATTLEQARAQHEAWRQSGRGAGEKPANPALDYAQREYRDEDFGDDFFVDLDKYGEDEQP